MKVVSEGQSTGIVYALEARLVFKRNPPITAAGMTIDGQWRRVHTIKSLIGVPNNLYDKQAIQHGYMEHDAAMALAYWLIADANRVHIQVRLVEHEFISTYKISMIKNISPINTYDYVKNLLKKTKMKAESKGENQ